MLTNDQMLSQLQSIPGVTSIDLLYIFGSWNCSCEYVKYTPEKKVEFKGEFKGRDSDLRTALLAMYDGLMQIAEHGIRDFGAPRLELQADEHEATIRDLD